MADNDNSIPLDGVIDIDTLTDDQIMNLSEEQINRTDELGGGENENGESTDPNNGIEDQAGTPAGNEDPNGETPSEGEDLSDAEILAQGEPTPVDPAVAGNAAPMEGTPNVSDPSNTGQSPEGNSQATPNGTQEAGQEPKDPSKETEAGTAKDGNEPKPNAGNAPEGMTPEQVNAAVEFHKAVTATFKADGKDFSVRSAEDAIRLMQQGVNYSRNMHELKPVRALHRMLADHQLDNPEKLSFLIDLSRGDKAAIQKLLAEKSIDPLDLDISNPSGYTANNYVGSAKDNAFRDALETAQNSGEGRTVLTDINSSWDDKSKEALLESPEIIGHLMEQVQSGVYGKIMEELRYQQAMGFLTQVPFLQAYNQVGQAMEKQGVFAPKQPEPQSGIAPLQSAPAPTQQQPVATGMRKVAQPKIEQPNPQISAPPSQPTGHQPAKPTVPDYDVLSDDDFMKMAPPV